MLAKSLVVFAALAAVVAAQPHSAQVSRHRAVAAGHGSHSQRAPIVDAEVKPAAQRMRKRKTCRPHTSQAAASSAPAATEVASSAVAVEVPTSAVGNAGSKPTLLSAPAVVATSSKAAEPVTSSKAAEPVTSSKAAEPVTSSKAAEPVTSSKAAEPVTSSKAAEPVTSSKAAEPVTSKAAEPATTSKAAAPATTSKAAEPVTTSKAAEPVTTSKAAEPSPTKKPTTGSGPSFLTGTQTGQGTFYNTGLVACGQTFKDTDHIAAVSHLLFDAFPGAGANPNNNPICGKKVRATFQGKSVDVAIVDRCEGCALTDLDFTPSAFNTIADPALGRINGVTWEWL